MAKKNTLEYQTLKIKSSNIIYISDIHFGVNSSSEEWQENIKDYFYEFFIPLVKNELRNNPDTVICCLGDVYHDRKSIDIDVNNLSIDIFEDLSVLLPVYIINGNHDLSKKTNKGNSSLRSVTNINNCFVIKEPTLLKFYEGTKCISNIAAIPYLGDCNDENKCLVEFNGKADYALMHTDISKMKFDNGMTIVGAVDAEKFNGRIISGHIHKRQEANNVIYVGSPYQLSRGDVGNMKGIYVHNLKDGSFRFIENTYSPVFQKIDITQFLNFTEKERFDVLRNNYNDIIIDEANLDKYKMSDIYEVINLCDSKRTQIVVIKSKTKNKDGEDIDPDEIIEYSLEQLIEQAIDNIDSDEETKTILKALSADYLKNAQIALDAQSATNL
jgi:DNA repair exonuclease SbcCD nuclease subunit